MRSSWVVGNVGWREFDSYGLMYDFRNITKLLMKERILFTD